MVSLTNRVKITLAVLVVLSIVPFINIWFTLHIAVMDSIAGAITWWSITTALWLAIVAGIVVNLIKELEND